MPQSRRAAAVTATLVQHERLAPLRSTSLLCLLLTTNGCVDQPGDDPTDATTETPASTTSPSPSPSSSATLTPPPSESTDTTASDSTGELDLSDGSSSDDGTSDSGSTTATSSDPTDSGDTDPGAFVVSGEVTRSVEPAPGNDAIGDLYVAIVDDCTFTPGVINAGVVAADLSAPDAAAPYSIAEIPNGTWYFIAFLDDDLDAGLPRPSPDSGDFVVSDGIGGLGCTEFTIDGADQGGVNIDLNFVLF